MARAAVIAGWHPVAASSDLAPRHVFHGMLLGAELALWRADDGHVNVWDNRCVHRGVRLSIGINDGHELRCQYHGWRYANRTGGCTYMPSHPREAPAASLRIPTYPAVERYGLVWTTLDPRGAGDGPPGIDLLDGAICTPLRGLPVDAPAEAAATALGAVADDVVFFVQPVDPARCVVRGVLAGAPPPAERLAVLLRHDQQLRDLRERLEAQAVARTTPRPAAAVPVAEPRSPALAEGGRGQGVDVVVRRAWTTAEGVRALELAPVGGLLPTVQPGCHIDLHLPGGLVRQYSLTNGPGEQDTYRIAVKLEPQSRGGSAAVHTRVQEGDVLRVTGPHSRFVLRRDAFRTVFLAGGIGITPLLAMAQALDTSGPDYELHVFAQSAAHVALADVVGRLRGDVHTHLGLDPDATRAAVSRVLGAYGSVESQVYVCGPAPMIAAVRAVAAELGWPEEAVHFEYFANSNDVDADSTFEVTLARSGRAFTVHAGETLLAALRAHGVDVESSCEQGACGTCEVPVLDGEPEHQDVYLRGSERARGDRMMACVSRAHGGRLVLDL